MILHTIKEDRFANTMQPDQNKTFGRKPTAGQGQRNMSSFQQIGAASQLGRLRASPGIVGIERCIHERVETEKGYPSIRGKP